MYRNQKLPTILIVDDDADDRRLISRALRKLNCEAVVELEDGAALLSHLQKRGERDETRSSQPAALIVLLDLNMPRMNGQEALEALKLKSDYRHIPTIVLTTSDADEEVQRCYDLGANAYIVKPSSPADLDRVAQSLHAFWMKTAALPAE